MVKRSREEPSPSSSPTTPSFTNIESVSADVLGHSSKYLQVSEELPRSTTVMKCSLPPHGETLTFSTFEEFEIHYSKDHANRCSGCGKNFPSDHFLELHIGENHDPLNDARRARGEKTYRCLVEGCDKICAVPQKRRMHLIDKHMFPKNYDFFIVNSGIDKRSSMLRPRHRNTSSAASRALVRDRHVAGTEETPKTTTTTTLGKSPGETQPDTEMASAPLADGSDPTRTPKLPLYPPSSSDLEMENLSTDFSTLRFVPPSVRFGRGGRRGGFSRS